MNFAKITACAFLALVAITSFAAKPVPFEYDSVRIVYDVDWFSGERVEAILPRSVLDSVFLNTDSTFLAPFGACACDCAGGDIFFYLSNDTNSRAAFWSNGFSRVCTKAADSLDLVFRVKDRSKLDSLKETLLKKGKPLPVKDFGGLDEDDDIDDERAVFLLDSLVKAQRNNPLKKQGR